MLRKVFEVVLETSCDSKLSHPLHVGMECNDFEIFSEYSDNEPSHDGTTLLTGALMRNFSCISEVPKSIFILIYCLEQEPLNDKEENTILLYVTEKFLQHYNFENGDLCYLKPVTCFELDKVVMGTKDEKSFILFKEDYFYENLLSKVCQKNVLCRQNDALLTYSSIINESLIFKYLTLDCQPFQQGILNVNSSFIIVNIEDGVETSKYLSYSDDSPGQISKKSEIISNFKLMGYTTNILGIHKILPAMTVHPLLQKKNLINTYEIRIFHKLPSEFIRELNRIEKNIDSLNTIFLSSKAIQNSNIKDRSWVKIKLFSTPKFTLRRSSSSSPPPSAIDPALDESSECSFRSYPGTFKFPIIKERAAFVCSISDEKTISNEEQVYMSPHLWFNLNQHPSKLMQQDARLYIEILDDFSPPYAKEVYASIIHSPNYDNSIKCDKMLTDYFNEPKYHCVGDIFSISSEGYWDLYTKDNDQEINFPLVYFRVATQEGPHSAFGYVCDNKHSRLYYTGTKHSYVPLIMETYYASKLCHPIWNSPIPSGLKYYVDLLQNLVFPFLSLQNKKFALGSNILFTGPTCCGKTTVVKSLCRSLNIHFYQINCFEFAGEISATAEAKLKIRLDKGVTYAPCVILLKNVHLIGKEKDINGEDSRVLYSLCEMLKSLNNYKNALPVVVIATTTDPTLLSNNLVSAFLHSVHMEAPNEKERYLILQDLLSVSTLSNDVSILYLAQRTAGFVLGDLCALVRLALMFMYSRIRKFVSERHLKEKDEEDIVLASVPLIQRDLLNALEKLQSEFTEAIGTPEIPNVAFDDVGGLNEVKREILDTIQLPLEHPEILSSGLRRSGVLLYGPPGTGKTLLAKAVATECSLNFLSVKGPELINMYVGQSEENVRAVFNQARSAVPCIIFFDELDSLAPNRGRSGDSGGVMDRVVSQLLAELDGLNKKTEVFVIGATNRSDLIDPALLRPGRFDRLLYVGIPTDKTSKLSILRAQTRKFPLAKDVNLEEIIDKCPPNVSGADFYSLCSNAVMKRVEKNVELIENEKKKPEELSNDVHMEDFLSALENLKPSVSLEQLEQYQQHDLT